MFKKKSKKKRKKRQNEAKISSNNITWVSLKQAPKGYHSNIVMLNEQEFILFVEDSKGFYNYNAIKNKWLNTYTFLSHFKSSDNSY